MKSHSINILILLVLNLSVSAQSQPSSIQSQLHQALNTYLGTYFSPADLKTYFKVNDTLTTVAFKAPLHQTAATGISPSWISAIEASVEVNIHGYHDFLNLELNKRFEVKENIASYRNNENLTATRINALKEFLELHKANQILSPDTILQYVNKTHPYQQWNRPNISRKSFPPYTFYYETLENHCNPCQKIYTKLNELTEIGENKVQMVTVK
jgi:hypothetical protein